MHHISMLDLKAEYQYMKADIDAAIQRCLEHQQWINGPEVTQLEKSIASYTGSSFAVGASSGTEALVLGLRALALKLKRREYFTRDDLIITTPLTFTATGDAILRSGATPVFIDIDPQTFNINPDLIHQFLANTKGVVGIVAVHLYGQTCAMDDILRLANKYNLFVVEDCAQCFGAQWQGRKLGSLGNLGTYSFFPSKNLGGYGDGGMIVSNDAELAEQVRNLTKHGGKDKNNPDILGYNARLDTLQAAILLAKLKYIDELNSRRQKVAEQYNHLLKGHPKLILPTIKFPGENHHVYHQFTARVKDGHRDTLAKNLKDKGIDTMIYYPVPLHRMNVFNGRHQTFGELMETDRAVREIISLPMDLWHEQTPAHVVDAINSAT